MEADTVETVKLTVAREEGRTGNDLDAARALFLGLCLSALLWDVLFLALY